MDPGIFLDKYQSCDCCYCDGLVNVQQLPSDLKIMHVNICSLNKNFDSLVTFLSSGKLNFDIIAISESGRLSSLETFNIQGYNVFYNESKINQRDGFLMYVKSDLVKESKIIKIENHIFLRILINKLKTFIGLTGIYRLPSADKQGFLESLNTLYSERIHENQQIEIFLGDINFNILNLQDVNVINYLNILQQYGFVSVVDKPTRERNDQAPSCLDHFFVKNSVHYDMNSRIVYSGLSDHYPIILNIKLRKEIVPSINNFIEKIDYHKVEDALNYKTWESVLECRNPNKCAEILVTSLKTILENATDKIYLKCGNRKLKPWITLGIINSIRTRDKLKKRSAVRKTVEAENAFRTYRDSLSKLIKITKNKYFSNKLEECKNDTKQVWRVVKKATNEKEKSVCQFKAVFDRQGEEVSETAEIAEAFNYHFSTIGKVMASKINKPNATNLNLATNSNKDSLFLKPITKNELIKQISTLKNNAAPGADKIPVILLKKFHKSLLDPILHLVNLIFETGTFPSIFKHAIVTPLHKSGDKKILSNYRPITLTSNLSKIIEKCLKLRLNEFLEKNKLLSQYQFGFKENYSTEDAINCVSDQVSTCFNNNEKCMVVFLDLGKAFDTVTHQILLSKLKNMGIRGITYDLFRSYIDGRTQSVKINDYISVPKTVDFGVPQGTVLGPVLFSIYMNELLHLLPSVGMVCFADDTAIIIKEKTWKETKAIAESALRKIKVWFDLNFLTLNSDKSSFLCFSISKKTACDFTNIILHDSDCQNTPCRCNKKIERQTKVKYLGVILDENLKWNHHVEYISTRIRKLIYKFYQLRQFMQKKTLTMIYLALVESILNYCITAWGGACKTTLQSIIITQKYILKIMLNKPKKFSSTILFKEAKVLQLNQIYLKAVFRILCKNTQYLNVISHCKNTRSAMRRNVTIPKASKTKFQRTLIYASPIIYNLLPIELRNKPYNKVKTKIHNWILDQNVTWYLG